MKESQLCQVCGKNPAVFAFQKAGQPTEHICTTCHQESLPEPARSLMKAMKSGPCRYCGQPGQAVDATEGGVFRLPFEKDYLCVVCQTEFIHELSKQSPLMAAKVGADPQELLKDLEKIARELDLKMKGEQSP